MEAGFDRAWQEEYGERRQGSVYHFAFLAHLYAGEADLEKRGLVGLFRKTQQLPDYRRAEDAVKRGWSHWVRQEFGIQKPTDELAVRQFMLLYDIRRAKSRETRRQILCRSSVPCSVSAKRGDDEFFRRLGRALEDTPRGATGASLMHVLLANWLTAFWWLMPLKAVASDMATVLEGQSVNTIFQNLRQVTTRRSPPRPGAFFSTGWNGVFYSADPPLIDFIQPDGSPFLNVFGRRLFV